MSSSSDQHHPAHTAGGLYDGRVAGPIFTLPAQAPSTMREPVSLSDSIIVTYQPQRASSLQGACHVVPAVAESDGPTERKVVVTQTNARHVGPAVAVSDGPTERKVVVTQTNGRYILFCFVLLIF